MGCRREGQRLHVALHIGKDLVRELRRYEGLAIDVDIGNIKGDVVAIATVIQASDLRIGRHHSLIDGLSQHGIETVEVIIAVAQNGVHFALGTVALVFGIVSEDSLFVEVVVHIGIVTKVLHGERNSVAVLRTLDQSIGQIGAEALEIDIVAIDSNAGHATFGSFAIGGGGVAQDILYELNAFGQNHSLGCLGCFCGEAGAFPICVKAERGLRASFANIFSDSCQCSGLLVEGEDNVLRNSRAVVSSKDPFGIFGIVVNLLSAGERSRCAIKGALDPRVLDVVGQACNVDVGTIDDDLDRLHVLGVVRPLAGVK